MFHIIRDSRRMFEVSRGCKIAYLGSQSGLALHVKQRFPLFSRESEVSLTRLNFKSTHLRSIAFQKYRNNRQTRAIFLTTQQYTKECWKIPARAFHRIVKIIQHGCLCFFQQLMKEIMLIWAWIWSREEFGIGREKRLGLRLSCS